MEDGRPDLPDGLVQIIDVGGEPFGLLVGRLGLRHQALQPDRRGEDPLDHVIVQVAGDAVAFFQDGYPVTVGAGLGQFEGQRDMPGESRRHVDVGVGEQPAVRTPAENERADTVARGDERNDHQRAAAPGQRIGRGNNGADQPVGVVAGRDLHDEFLGRGSRQ